MILGIPQTEKDQRSFTVEEMALKAGKYWQKKKVIKKAIQTRRFSSDDLKGKDIILEHLDGRKLAIDVKTYWDSEKEKECQKKGVFLLPMRPEEDERRIRERILGLIILDLISGLKMEQIREVISVIIKKKEGKAKVKPGLVKRIIARLKNFS